jgi:dethiobiotin synthetase
VVLVVGLRLGCLNHAVLTAAAIHACGAPIAGWVASAVDAAFERPADNLQALGELLQAPCLGVLDHQPRATVHELAPRLCLSDAAPDS